MQAALYRAGGRIELTEVADPAPPGPGEAIVAVQVCGICGSDLHVFRGEAPPLGLAGGHEFAGTVVAVGPDVERPAPGDRVAVEPIARCGRCGFCRTGQTSLCDRMEFIGFRRHGGFAEFVRMPADCLYPLPDGLDWAVAALAEPLAVGVRAVRLAGVTGDTSVAVIGGGAIGLLAALAAIDRGARRIAITTRYPHQQAAAERLGVATVPTPRGVGASRPIQNALGGRPDVVIEAVGGESAEPVADAIGAIRRGGTIVLTGIFTGAIAVPVTRIVRKEALLRGSYCYGHDALTGDFPAAIELLGRLAPRLGDLITHQFRHDAIQAAFETAAGKDSGALKVQVRVGKTA